MMKVWMTFLLFLMILPLCQPSGRREPTNSFPRDESELKKFEREWCSWKSCNPKVKCCGAYANCIGGMCISFYDKVFKHGK
nr:conotoxin I1 M6.64 [Conus magus]